MLLIYIFPAYFSINLIFFFKKNLRKTIAGRSTSRFCTNNEVVHCGHMMPVISSLLSEASFSRDAKTGDTIKKKESRRSFHLNRRLP